MARTAVTRGKLLKIEGVDEVLANITKTMSRVKGKEIKAGYVRIAREELASRVHANIDGLPVSQDVKEVLHAAAVTNAGPEEIPNAVVMISQQAAIKRLGRSGGRIPNPYWWEYGTMSRVTKAGRRTGQITPSPFFRRAVTASRGAILAALVKLFQGVVDKPLK
jgi:hypothetical protein